MNVEQIRVDAFEQCPQAGRGQEVTQRSAPGKPILDDALVVQREIGRFQRKQVYLQAAQGQSVCPADGMDATCRSQQGYPGRRALREVWRLARGYVT
ncbi:Uncharacterised protein [Bordetella pertussis]|nr:Uncharacterised protein [Bordetella pertussis]